MNANVIRNKRRSMNITQKDISDACKITQAYYSQIEHGAVPTVRVLQDICIVLELKLSDVLDNHETFKN